MQFSSLCAQEAPDKRSTKPHGLPIYATSSFEFESVDQGIRIFGGEEKGHIYARFGNPTVDGVAEKLAALETFGTDIKAHSLLFSSGMAAISTLCIAILKSGDTILTQGNIYGGTSELFQKVLAPLGIKIQITTLDDLNKLDDTLRADTSIKLVYFETPANPTLACVDIEGICTLARQHGRMTAVDNTFCTPYLQQPLRMGADFVVHSTTKYLNGHGNIIGGALIGRDVELMQTRVWQVLKLAGPNTNAWDAWLLNQGLKTLPLRMDRHCSNAMAIAQYLSKHAAVAQVNYTGLPEHPSHALAVKQMSQHGGMLSFELKGGMNAGVKLINGLTLCTLAPTLGDTDTLVLHPASSSHYYIDREVRMANGITDGLVRMSCGIEHVDDILADLEQALAL